MANWLLVVIKKKNTLYTVVYNDNTNVLYYTTNRLLKQYFQLDEVDLIFRTLVRELPLTKKQTGVERRAREGVHRARGQQHSVAGVGSPVHFVNPLGTNYPMGSVLLSASLYIFLYFFFSYLN